jgi:S-adenosylmethionine/arginine decarboxylase-like enzyme
MAFDHKHMVIDAVLLTPPTSAAVVADWLSRLAAALGMNVLSGPHVCECMDEGNEGVTGIVVLSTSHCSIHVWDRAESPFARIDVYSCRPFDESAVGDMVMEFGPTSYSYVVIDRNGQRPKVVAEVSTRTS